MEILTKIGSAVSSWWKNFTMDDDARFLSKAVDHVDFENRMKVILNQNRNNFNLGA
jgi:hypothetical protein